MVNRESPIVQLTETDLFRKISEICSAVNRIRTEKELLDVSLKKIIDLFKVTRGSIFILDEDQKKLVLKVSCGLKRNEKEKMVKQMGEGIVGRVAELKEPVVVSDISSDLRFENYKPRKSYNTSSFICVPLLIKDQLIGVINITDKESGACFQEHDVLLLDFLTSQIALNYRRVQLYNKFKDIVKETKTLKNKLGESKQEKQYLQSKIEINEKLATIGKLAGGIAHEFNNPLDGVMRYTNLCLDHMEADEVVRGYLLEIKSGLNRMAKIVKNLLACSRNQILSGENIDIAQTARMSLKAHQLEIEKKNIQVELDVEDPMPLIPDLGLERVFSNLIRNAVDSIENEGIITIRSYLKKGHIFIEIRDTGSGIPDETVGKIFEPFFTTKDIEKGCGLGLTIVGEIIKSYKGKIRVGSREGEGTTFTVDIPFEGNN